MVIGGSGVGTSTLGRNMALKLGIKHVDSDEIYWEITNPEYQTPKPLEKRMKLLEDNCPSDSSWVLSGSTVGWSDHIKGHFTHVIWLTLSHDMRMDRLRKRELLRYGAKALPGGSRYEMSMKFLNWAEKYDDGDLNIRSIRRHKNWLDGLDCKIINIDSSASSEQLLKDAIMHL